MLSTLLSQHYAVDFIFDLIKDKRNGRFIEAIETQLNNGQTIAMALKPYLPHAYRSYFDGLIQVLPLDATLTQCDALIQTKKSQRQFWIKHTLPSIGLLLICLIGMLLFRNLGIPMIQSLADSFHQSLSWITPLDHALLGLIFGLMVILICVVIIAVLLMIPKGLLGLMRVSHHLSAHHLLVQLVSVDFSVYFNLCLKAGLSTIDTLQLLASIHRSIVAPLSNALLSRLEKGNGFHEALSASGLDDTLIKFLTLSEYSGKASLALDAYGQVTTMTIGKKSTRMAKIIQIACYGCIGALIICIYQVLFLPMNIIANM